MQRIVSSYDAYTCVFFILFYIMNENCCKPTSTTSCQKKAAGNGESVISMCSYSTASTFNLTNKNMVFDVTSGLREKVPGSCTCIVGQSDLAGDLAVIVYTFAYFNPGYNGCGTSVKLYTDPSYIHRNDCTLDRWTTKLNTKRFITITYTQHEPPYDENYCIKMVPSSVVQTHGLKVFCLPFVPKNQSTMEVPAPTTESMSSLLPSNTTSGTTPLAKPIGCSDINVPVLVTVIIALFIIICSIIIHVLLFLRKRKSETLTKSNVNKNQAIQFVSTVPVEYESIRKSSLVPATSNTYDDLRYEEDHAEDGTVVTKTNSNIESSVKLHDVSHDYILPKESMAYENCDMSSDRRESSQCLVSLDANYADTYVEPNNKNVVSRSDSSYIIPVS